MFELESKLFPVLFEMKSKGVRVDLDRAESIKKDFENTEKKILDRILQDTGVAVDIWAAASVAKAFDSLKIPYERTAKSKQPKFDKGFLSNHDSELAKMVVVQVPPTAYALCRNHFRDLRQPPRHRANAVAGKMAPDGLASMAGRAGRPATRSIVYY